MKINLKFNSPNLDRNFIIEKGCVCSSRQQGFSIDESEFKYLINPEERNLNFYIYKGVGPQIKGNRLVIKISDIDSKYLAWIIKWL